MAMEGEKAVIKELSTKQKDYVLKGVNKLLPPIYSSLVRSYNDVYKGNHCVGIKEGDLDIVLREMISKYFHYNSLTSPEGGNYDVPLPDLSMVNMGGGCFMKKDLFEKDFTKTICEVDNKSGWDRYKDMIDHRLEDDVSKSCKKTKGDKYYCEHEFMRYVWNAKGNCHNRVVSTEVEVRDQDRSSMSILSKVRTAIFTLMKPWGGVNILRKMDIFFDEKSELCVIEEGGTVVGTVGYHDVGNSSVVTNLFEEQKFEAHTDNISFNNPKFVVWYIAVYKSQDNEYAKCVRISRDNEESRDDNLYVKQRCLVGDEVGGRLVKHLACAGLQSSVCKAKSVSKDEYIARYGSLDKFDNPHYEKMLMVNIAGPSPYNGAGIGSESVNASDYSEQPNSLEPEEWSVAGQ